MVAQSHLTEQLNYMKHQNYSLSHIKIPKENSHVTNTPQKNQAQPDKQQSVKTWHRPKHVKIVTTTYHSGNQGNYQEANVQRTAMNSIFYHHFIANSNNYNASGIKQQQSSVSYTLNFKESS